MSQSDLDLTGFVNANETEFHFVAHTTQPDQNNFPPHTAWIHLHFSNVRVLEKPDCVQMGWPHPWPAPGRRTYSSRRAWSGSSTSTSLPCKSGRCFHFLKLVAYSVWGHPESPQRRRILS